MRAKQRYFNQRSGYTLLEILIVVSIISMFTALSIGYYRNFDDQRKLDGDTKQVIDVLNLAANRANSGDLNPNPICPDFQGYAVTIGTSNTYSLQFNCGNVYTAIQNYRLDSGLCFVEVGTNVLFKPLTAGTNLLRSTGITINSLALSKCQQISVDPAGTVNEAPSCQFSGCGPTPTP